MAELRVPRPVANPFREHYRELILGTALHTAEAEADRLRERGRELRARRAERDAELLRALTGAEARHRFPLPPVERWFGRRVRTCARLAWLAAAGLLAADLLALGPHGWTTAVADAGLIVLTFLWFGASVDDLLTPPPPPAEQLELFE